MSARVYKIWENWIDEDLPVPSNEFTSEQLAALHPELDEDEVSMLYCMTKGSTDPKWSITDVNPEHLMFAIKDMLHNNQDGVPDDQKAVVLAFLAEIANLSHGYER
jgi:hypothetical protein